MVSTLILKVGLKTGLREGEEIRVNPKLTRTGFA